MVERFLLAYSLGLALHGYEDSPLEKMAYDFTASTATLWWQILNGGRILSGRKSFCRQGIGRRQRDHFKYLGPLSLDPCPREGQ
jgi:hypothetical protein